MIIMNDFLNLYQQHYFLYHLASYETGGDVLVNCGIIQSLIKVVNYYDESQDFIMVQYSKFFII
jgi:hypothetical protein